MSVATVAVSPKMPPRTTRSMGGSSINFDCVTGVFCAYKHFQIQRQEKFFTIVVHRHDGEYLPQTLP